MTPPNRHGSAVVEFPTELEIVTTRKFDAPVELVYDVLTKPEHVRNWFAPFEDEMTVCEIDLRVGGDYHIVIVTPEGKECSFRGTYLELERADRMARHGGSRAGGRTPTPSRPSISRRTTA